jgi:hypothetical protein
MTSSLPAWTESFEGRLQQQNAALAQLQQQELALHEQLSQPSLAADQRTALVAQLSNLVQLQTGIYQTQQDSQHTEHEQLTHTFDTLQQQQEALRTVDAQLRAFRSKQKRIGQRVDNTERLVEISTYYGQQNAATVRLCQLVVWWCTLLLGLTFVYRLGVLPWVVWIGGCLVVLGCALYSIASNWVDVTSRDPKFFNQYSWSFDSTTAPSPPTPPPPGTATKVTPWNASQAPCEGAACCAPGLLFDANQNVCTSSASSPATSGPFVSTASSTAAADQQSASVVGEWLSAPVTLLTDSSSTLTSWVAPPASLTESFQGLDRYGYRAVE